MVILIIRTYIRQFRERKYPLHFDNTVKDALWRANCHKTAKRRENRRYLKEAQRSRSKHYNRNVLNDQAVTESMATADKTRKRDIREWGYDRSNNNNSGRLRNPNGVSDPKQPHHRGDIPVINGDCDGK